MNKEKHKWKKVRTTKYLNFMGEPDHHFVLKEEFYECTECGATKLIDKK